MNIHTDRSLSAGFERVAFSTAVAALIFPLVMSAVGCSTLDKPFLYHAEKADRKIELFGTIHAGVPGWDLPTPVTTALKTSNRVYFEADLLADAKPPLSQIYIEEGQLPLDLRLTPKEFRTLVQTIPKIPVDQLKQLRPIFVQALVSENERVQVSQYEARIMDYKNGLDMTLMREAAKYKLPVETLDTENALPCLDEVDEIAFGELRKMLSGQKLQSDYEELRQLSDSYRRGDEKSIAARLDAEQTECVLKERNSRWSALLEKNVRSGDHVFVAVGVGHLIHTKAGPSLVELLQKQGYKIKRVGDDAAQTP